MAVSDTESSREKIHGDFQQTAFDSMFLVRDWIPRWYKSPSVQMVLHHFKQIKHQNWILQRSFYGRSITLDMCWTIALMPAWHNVTAAGILHSSPFTGEMGIRGQVRPQVGQTFLQAALPLLGERAEDVCTPHLEIKWRNQDIILFCIRKMYVYF